MMTPGPNVPDKASVARLWVHELYRVFYDRLVFDEDRDYLFNNVKTVAHDVLGVDFDVIFEQLNMDNAEHVTDQHLRSLVFCDFEDPKGKKSVCVCMCVGGGGVESMHSFLLSPPSPAFRMTSLRSSRQFSLV